MEDVEGEGELLRFVVAHDGVDVPDGRAEVGFAGVILEQGLDADFVAELDEVFDFGAHGLELIPDGLVEVVLVIEHAEALHTEAGGGAEDGLGALVGADLVDARGQDGEVQVSLLEFADELGEFVLDALGFDVAFGANGGFDAIDAHFGGDVGDLVEGQALEMFGEEAKFVACALAGGGGERGNGGGERAGEGGSGLEEVTAVHGGEEWNVRLGWKCAGNQWVKCGTRFWREPSRCGEVASHGDRSFRRRHTLSARDVAGLRGVFTGR